MALSDLTGTTWIFPDPPNLTDYPFSRKLVYINFTAGVGTYKAFYAGESYIYYMRASNSSYQQVWAQSGGYPWDNYRTITITGGTYATNATFISWLENHATQFFTPYRVFEPALVATADAIRARGGTSAEIEWKANGFADAITNMVVPIPSDYGHIAWDGHTLTVS